MEQSVSVANVRGVRGSGRYPVGLGGSSLLLMAGILVVPSVIAGYVGLTALLFLPLLGLRRMFPRTSNGHAGAGTLWDTATTRA